MMRQRMPTHNIRLSLMPRNSKRKKRKKRRRLQSILTVKLIATLKLSSKGRNLTRLPKLSIKNCPKHNLMIWMNGHTRRKIRETKRRKMRRTRQRKS